VLVLLGSALVLLAVTVWLEAMVVALVAGVGAQEALARATHDPGMLAIAQTVGLGVPLLLAARLSDGGLRGFFARALSPCPWDRVLFAFLAGLALQLPMVEIAHVVAELAPALRHSAEDDAALRETMRIRDVYSAITVPLALVVSAPVTEELLFRAFAQHELAAQARSRGLGRILALGFVAVIFAIFHLDPVSTPSILVAGLALGAIADRWQSVRISIALHAGVNLVPVAVTEHVLPIPGFNDADPDVHVSPLVLAASAAVFVIAFALAWRGGARIGDATTPS
jgi:membrane protease YdiL (CAAX protease family)